MTDYYEHKLDPVGVRPDWLADDDICNAFWPEDVWACWPVKWTASSWSRWEAYTAIHIPRDHWAVPYLERGETPPSTKPTASEHPEYSPELVERAFALLRTYNRPDDFGDEARAILSELDKSKEVDPLEVKAREIVRKSYPEVSDDYNGRRMTIAKAALLAGMELAKDEAAYRRPSLRTPTERKDRHERRS